MFTSRIIAALRRRLFYPFRSKFLPFAHVNNRGQVFRVDLRDVVISRILYTEGEYKKDIFEIIENMDLAGSICCDIGANIGLHTMAISKQVGENGKVYAFEPAFDNYSLLIENIKLNHAKNVVPKKFGIGSESGTATIRLSGKNLGDHQIVKTKEDTDQVSRESETVEIHRLDDFMSEIPSRKIKLIKINVQGFEGEVISGATQTFQKNPDVFVTLEMDPSLVRKTGWTATKLLQRMESMGFKSWEILPHRIMPAPPPATYELMDDLKCVNLVFCRNEKLLNQVLEKWKGWKI